MATIDTLIVDIQKTVGNMSGTPSGGFSPERLMNITDAYSKQMTVRPPKVRDDKTLYFSEVGDVCTRRMFYKFHDTTPEILPPDTKVKFMYGDYLENLVLQLAEDAGHKVTNEQDVVEYVHPTLGWKIRGRIDARIDGVVVDVKSVTKMSEMKFHSGLHDDPFGYYGQLNGYSTVLKSKDMGFLTIQKELGHINYFPFEQDTEKFAHNIARAIKAVDSDEPLGVPFDSVAASATSPNMKLCVTCSYCPYKRRCFPEVRGFSYSNKVEWLTKVVQLPKVPEIVSVDL